MDIKVFQTLITTSFTVVKNEYSLLLTPINDGIYIYLILVQKPFREKGLGKSIMVELTSLSNKLNTPIYLIPVPIPDEDTTYEELVRFYKKCGFNRDKTSRYWKYNPKPDVFKQVG